MKEVSELSRDGHREVRLGLTWVIAGPPVTVNAFAKMTTSEPLLTVRVRVPVAAAAPIES